MKEIIYFVGSAEIVTCLSKVPAMVPFSSLVINYLDEVSRILRDTGDIKRFPDIAAFAFWIRKKSISKLKERFLDKGEVRLGRGVAFHVAPSNVPTVFAYSLVFGLLSGNSNIVKLPSSDFPQIGIIVSALNKAMKNYPTLTSYVICVRYERNKSINDLFSSIADLRVVWGGDRTIANLRESPLPPRSLEISFADRYSIAVIDADFYLEKSDKAEVARLFYNDVFIFDQRACTSPSIVVWIGNKVDEGRKVFWDREHDYVKRRYTFQAVQGVNKLVKSYLFATVDPESNIEERVDNLIIRVTVKKLTRGIMEYREGGGYFYEYLCKDIMELSTICNDTRCQTIGYIGNNSMFSPLLRSGVKGIDRIVPVGRTMDFDLIWDGYKLPTLMTRTVAIV